MDVVLADNRDPVVAQRLGSGHHGRFVQPLSLVRAPHPVNAVPIIAAFGAAFSIEMLWVPELGAFAFFQATGMVLVNGGGVIAAVAVYICTARDLGKDTIGRIGN